MLGAGALCKLFKLSEAIVPGQLPAMALDKDDRVLARGKQSQAKSVGSGFR